MPTSILMTFDFEGTETGGYAEAYDAFVAIGLSHLYRPGKRLPYSSRIGVL